MGRTGQATPPDSHSDALRLRVRVTLLVLIAGHPVFTSPSRAEQPAGCDVALVLTTQQPYEQAAGWIKEVLSQASRRCVVVRIESRGPGEQEENPPASSPNPAEAPALDTGRAARQLAEARPKVIVTAGALATALALKAVPDVPVVFCLVPNALDRPFIADEQANQPRLAGVTTDIDSAEYVSWIRKLNPTLKTLGIPCAEHSKRTVEDLAATARKQGLTVVAIPTKRDQFADAIQKLDEKSCDGVLMVADADVYNSASVQRLLLWGLRSRKPVWTFSANVTKAGAFAGLYADPQAMARQAAGMALKLLNKEENAKALGWQYPDRVLAALNERTAEIIGAPVKKEILETLAARFGAER